MSALGPGIPAAGGFLPHSAAFAVTISRVRVRSSWAEDDCDAWPPSVCRRGSRVVELRLERVVGPRASVDGWLAKFADDGESEVDSKPEDVWNVDPSSELLDRHR